MKTAFLSSAYLAPVQYYSKLAKYDCIRLEQHDHYIKQTYRNRCIIGGPGGDISLTIPVIKPEASKCPMKDIRISEHGNWRHLHWNAIESAYSSTPFYEYYKDYFKPFYEQKFEFLVDFNEQLCHLICDLIDIHPNIIHTDFYQIEMNESQEDFRETIHPKKDFCAQDPNFNPKPYYQVFDYKLGFRPNLSIIDLLFNMGPESIFYL